MKMEKILFTLEFILSPRLTKARSGFMSVKNTTKQALKGEARRAMDPG
jgi:hypothetical protein